MWWLLICQRITLSVGHSPYLHFCTEQSHVDEVIQKSNLSVIIYEDVRYRIDFADYGLYRYSQRIQFAAALEKFAPKKCSRFPCFVAYGQGTELIIDQPKWRAPLFALWCEQILNYDTHRLNHKEELRSILSDKRPVVFGVGEKYTTRPNNIPSNVTFYTVESHMFSDLHVYLDISPGYWVLRPEDRQIVPLGNNYNDARLTLVKSPHDTVTKRYLVGYVLSKSDEKDSTVATSILNSLAKKLSNTVQFLFSNDEEWASPAKQFKMNKLVAPYMFMLDLKNSTRPLLYYLQGEDSYNLKTVEKFVDRVQRGKEPVPLISERVPDQKHTNFKQVASKDLQNLLINKKATSVLALTAPWCNHCKHLKPVLNATADLLAKTNPNIHIYWIDGTHNDLPNFIPEWTGYPTVFLWPSGSNFTNPVTMKDGNHKVDAILSWIKEHSGRKDFVMPKYDEDAIQKRIKQERLQQ